VALPQAAAAAAAVEIAVADALAAGAAQAGVQRLAAIAADVTERGADRVAALVELRGVDGGEAPERDARVEYEARRKAAAPRVGKPSSATGTPAAAAAAAGAVLAAVFHGHVVGGVDEGHLQAAAQVIHFACPVVDADSHEATKRWSTAVIRTGTRCTAV
jgi:hypothetical protein